MFEREVERQRRLTVVPKMVGKSEVATGIRRIEVEGDTWKV